MPKPIDKDYLETNLKNFYDGKIKDKINNNIISGVCAGGSVYDSAEGNIIAFKGNGYTEQKSYSGKNLLNPTLQTTTQNGITCTNNGDGTYTLNGTATAYTTFLIQQVDTTNLIGNTYKITGVKSGSNVGLAATDDYSTSSQCIISSDEGKEYPIKEWTSGRKFFRLYIIVENGKTVSNAIVKPMLTTDLSATYDDFEPYVGGIPSPNPDYPQEIKAYGDMGWFDGELVQGAVGGTDKTYVSTKSYIECSTSDNLKIITERDYQYIFLYCFDINKTQLDYRPSYREEHKDITFSLPTGTKYIRITFGYASSSTTYVTPETAGHITVLKSDKYCAPVKSVGKNIFDIKYLINATDWKIITGYAPYFRAIKMNNLANKKFYISCNNSDFTFSYIGFTHDISDRIYNVDGISTEYPNGRFIDFTDKKECYLFIASSSGDLESKLSQFLEEMSKMDIQIEEGETATEFEPYQESVALIPTSQPFYEGDYIQLNADGSGVEHRENGRMIFNGTLYKSSYKSTTTNAHAYLLDYLVGIVKKPSSDLCEIICDRFRQSANDLRDISGIYTVINNIGNTETYVYFPSSSEINTLVKFNTWLQTNNVETVYPLATPTDTPLTAYQLQEIRKLMSFNNQTTFSTDPYHPEIEVQYYKNTENGEVVNGIEEKTNNSIKKIDNQLSNQLSGLIFSIVDGQLVVATTDGTKYSFAPDSFTVPPTPPAPPVE